MLLAIGLKRLGHDVTVVTFYPGGAFAEELHTACISHLSVEKAGRWDVLGFAVRLARAVSRLRPDYLHSYLPMPNVVSAVLWPFLRARRLVWGVRASDMKWSYYDSIHRIANRLELLLSRVPDLIIANSQAGAQHHVRIGFPADRVIVIPNGIDVDAFAPNASLREKTRRRLCYSDADLVVGCFARLDPMKGHEHLLQAFGRVASEYPAAHLLLVGDGSAAIAAAVDRTANALGLQARLRRLRSQREVAAHLNACDVFVSASLFGEGFSNAIAEAMACGVACVVTDVGDSARILGDAGVAVSADDLEAMAAAIGRLLSLPAEERGALGIRARQRVIENFSIAALVARTERALAALS